MISDTLHSFLPSRKKSSNNNSTKELIKKTPQSPWWNENCTETVELKKKALKVYRKNPTMENYINFKIQAAVTKRLLKKEKRQGWRKFCASITPQSKFFKIWKIIKKFKNRFLGSKPSDPTSNNGISSEVQGIIDSLCPPSNLNKIEIIYNDQNNPLTWGLILETIRKIFVYENDAA